MPTTEDFTQNLLKKQFFANLRESTKNSAVSDTAMTVEKLYKNR
jgi:hypothetical protein